MIYRFCRIITYMFFIFIEPNSLHEQSDLARLNTYLRHTVMNNDNFESLEMIYKKTNTSRQAEASRDKKNTPTNLSYKGGEILALGVPSTTLEVRCLIVTRERMSAIGPKNGDSECVLGA